MGVSGQFNVLSLQMLVAIHFFYMFYIFDSCIVIDVIFLLIACY
ncbi:hypothetical protein CAXC1_180047 [Candidatus Xenohaliotis californiensis]|uniref:Uncharacterized protein n=1 Tax=Candidatus Xenohaliotis californiensis TaxID=84677 RepID=A0ABM9N7J2_9RICK|nr:hypothetical protein CAXC1_180047 [Candidatus Xenohaliotis californiensis]